jgi:hypothetical protein
LIPLTVGGLYSLLGTTSGLVLVAISALSSSFTAVVALWTARLARLSPNRAVLVGLLVALDPTGVFFGIAPMTDAFFALACFLSVYFLLRARRDGYSTASIAGLALSLVAAVLTKSSVLLLPLIPCVVLLRARRVVPAIAVVVAFAIPVVAWTVRNYNETGIPQYSTVAVYGLLFERAAGTEVRATGHDYKKVVEPQIQRELSRRLGYSGIRSVEYYTTPANKQVYDEELDLALDIIRKHPVYYVGAIPVGLARLFLGSELVAPAVEVAMVALYAVLYLVAAVKWLRLRRYDPFLAWLVVAFVAYFAISAVLVATTGFGGTRIAMPFIPLIYLVAAWQRPADEPGVVPADAAG